MTGFVWRQVECVPYTSPLTASIPTHLMPELPRRSRGDVVPTQPYTVTILPEVSGPQAVNPFVCTCVLVCAHMLKLME